jgi:PKD repeat protein
MRVYLATAKTASITPSYPMKRTLPFILAGYLLPGLASAQQPTVLCATDLMRARAIAEHPELLLEEQQLAEEIDQLLLSNAHSRDGEVTYVIPVVFHVLHLGGRENITNDQVLDAMAILNRDFDKRNADTISVHPSMRDRIARMNIRFQLATRDPQGGCTNGIVRYRSAETLRGESTSKIDPWPRSRYMNVWVVDRILSGAAGYFSPGPPWGDGIVILNDYTGSIGTGQVGRSRALTHEVGHYLNLSHVWGSNNGVPDPNTPQWAMQAVCGDDGVEDTPFTRGWSSCQASNNTTRPWADCDRQSFKTNVSGTLQPGIRYDFANVTTSSGSTDPTPAPIVRDSINQTTERVSGSAFSAVGVSANSSVNGRFGFSNWGTGAADGETDYANLTGTINTGKYYQFTITPTLQQQSTIRTITFVMSRSENGPRTFALRSSQNNYASNLAVTGTGIASQTGNVAFIVNDAADDLAVTCTLPASGFANLEQAMTFRIYAWNSEDAAGAFIVDDVNIAGLSGTIENVENYMEYSYCSKMFSIGQRDRARSALLSTTTQRANLWTDENLQQTGVADGFVAICPPQADFYCQVGTDPANPSVPYAPFSCTNTNVRFYDNTQRAFPTGWSWTFQDGVPATSNQRNPTVQFTSPGWKTVTLTVTSEGGQDSKTDPYAVFIGGPEVSLTPYYESFETQTGTDPYPYIGINHEGNHTQFRRFVGGGATGNACVWLNSGDRNQLDFLIDPDNIGDYDDFYTPIFNLSGAPSATLAFRYAYNTNTNTTADITEKLEVESSTDCGRTWLSRATITGTQLVTNGTSATVPPNNWTLRSISLPGSVMSQNVRFRFRFVSSAWSGNLFLDDIWIGVPVGIDEVGANAFISLFPNPANDRFNVQVVGMESSPTTITITDMRGAEVFRQTFQPQGGNGIDISSHEAGLADGMYLLRAQNAAGSSAQKLVVGH